MRIPHNKEIERLVLGTIIGERGKIDEVREILTPDCFFDTEYRSIYESACRISDKGNRPDMLSIHHELNDKIDVADIADLLNYSTFDIYQHALILSDLSRRRKLVELGAYISKNAGDETFTTDQIMTETNERILNLYTTSNDNIRTIDDVIKDVVEQVSSNARGDSRLVGSPTGFHKFDNKAGGLQPSDLVIIAGETSQGKTALALSMIINAAKSGAGIALFTLEMRDSQLVSRMLGAESGVPSTSIMYSKLDEQDFRKLDIGIGKLSGKRIYFDERSTSNIDTIISSIRTLKKRYDIEGVVIDYLQVLNVNMRGSNQEQQMGDVARRLKNLAKDLNIWVIALSQLSRDNQNPEPTMNRLRASGQIAEAADIVCLVYRPEEYSKRYSGEFSDKETKGTAMLHFAKGRNIGTMKFICGFERTTQKFYELDDVPVSTDTPDNYVPY
jgi:replicative DNA helicase